jgi:hypothetical protein
MVGPAHPYTPYPPGRGTAHNQEELSMQRQFSLVSLTGIVLFGLAGNALAKDTAIGKLQGYAEVPAVASAASDRFKAVIKGAQGTIDYELSYDGLEGEVRQGHIHMGQHGANGGIMVWICQTSFNADPTGLAPTCLQSGTMTGTLTAANVIGPSGQGVDPADFAALVEAIRKGVAYANVHTTKFPSGEVRGQLMVSE